MSSTGQKFYEIPWREKPRRIRMVGKPEQGNRTCRPPAQDGSHQERPEKLQVQNQQAQRTGDAKDHQGLSLNKSLQNIWKLGSSSSHFTRQRKKRSNGQEWHALKSAEDLLSLESGPPSQRKLLVRGLDSGSRVWLYITSTAHTRPRPKGKGADEGLGTKHTVWISHWVTNHHKYSGLNSTYILSHRFCGSV